MSCLHSDCNIEAPLTLGLCSEHFGLAVELDLLDEVRDHLGPKSVKSRKYKPYTRKSADEYAPAKTALGRRAPAGAPLAFLQEHVRYAGSDCLIWPFARMQKGYPELRYQNKPARAHRVMCRLAHGEPPESWYEASHTCEQGHLGCVNPNHLIWETHYENHQRRRGLPHSRSGEARVHNRASLTPEQVLTIWNSDKNPSQLARDFGTSPTAIYKIKSQQSWKWLTKAAS